MPKLAIGLVYEDQYERVEVRSSNQAIVLLHSIKDNFGLSSLGDVEIYKGEHLIDLDKTFDALNISNNDLLQIVVRRRTSRISRPGAMADGLSASVSSMEIAAQQEIEKRIQQDNILRNMQNAMDKNPESFVPVLMLYVPIQIKDSQLAAFVDSGAQATIISKSMADACGISYLIDERFHGVAVGVGERKIIGRIHEVEIYIGTEKYACALTVLDDDHGAQLSRGGQMDFLLGLDMLKRHDCMIDLKHNCLRIGSNNAVPFLPESELPDHAKLTRTL